MLSSSFSLLAVLAALAAAAPTQELCVRQSANAYAPSSTTCPKKTSLVREAIGLNADEAAYVKKRKTKADAALATWLEKQGSFCATDLPSVGLASSGGSIRALLESAGVVQAFDVRDGNETVGGIFQGLTYQSGLSGGAWFLSSLAGNNWPTISQLRENLWDVGFENSLFVPDNIFTTDFGPTIYDDVVAQIDAKEAAGFEATVVDPWGRLFAYSLLEGTDGGVKRLLSDLTSFSNFTCHEAPFPIITAISVDAPQANASSCGIPTTAPQYEFTPYEYGSWESGISAFANTEYMGTSLSAGLPTDPSKCIVEYDNLAYIFGTSSDIWVNFCVPPPPSNDSFIGIITDIATEPSDADFEDLVGLYPNPFYNLPTSPNVSTEETLLLVDGGLSGRNVPIWPFLNERTVDVLITSDNSADTEFSFPDGSALRQTYLNALAAGIARMPFIPTNDTFVEEGLNRRATFFGCNETDTMFIVYLPNTDYVFPSNQSTSRLQYTVEDTAGMIANGVAIATQNGTEGWPFCLACGIMNAAEVLPEGCDECFKEYCYYQ